MLARAVLPTSGFWPLTGVALPMTWPWTTFTSLSCPQASPPQSQRNIQLQSPASIQHRNPPQPLLRLWAHLFPRSLHRLSLRIIQPWIQHFARPNSRCPSRQRYRSQGPRPTQRHTPRGGQRVSQPTARRLFSRPSPRPGQLFFPPLSPRHDPLRQRTQRAAPATPRRHQLCRRATAQQICRLRRPRMCRH